MGDSADKQKGPGFFAGVKAEFKKIIWPNRVHPETVCCCCSDLFGGRIDYRRFGLCCKIRR